MDDDLFIPPSTTSVPNKSNLNSPSLSGSSSIEVDSTVLHPRFKLHWLPDEQKASHEEFLRDEFNAEQDYGANSSAL